MSAPAEEETPTAHSGAAVEEAGAERSPGEAAGGAEPENAPRAAAGRDPEAATDAEAAAEADPAGAEPGRAGAESPPERAAEDPPGGDVAPAAGSAVPPADDRPAANAGEPAGPGESPSTRPAAAAAPDAEAPGPETSPAEPETSADQPETSPAQPETSAAEPETSVAEPGASAAQPETSVGQPETTAAQLETSVAEPDASPAQAETSAAQAGADAAGDPAAAAAESPPAPPSEPERPELQALRDALATRQPVAGRVIGWNQGGFHLVVDGLSAFCPRSEMEAGEVQDPESYLEQTLQFRVLRIQKGGRRIVVSRAAHLRGEIARQRSATRKRVKAGAVLDGTVASLTDFGAFVDLGGVQGLLHVSEISHRRIEHPQDVLSTGDRVRVQVLKVEKGGRRVSLSMRALEDDPWSGIEKRFPRGTIVKGTVEHATSVGAFIELAPGVTGLLPARSMSIPRETTPARMFPPGKQVSVQVLSVDRRRQRISLAPEGSALEGSRNDYEEYRRSQSSTSDGGFNALASAFRRLEPPGD